MKKLIPILLCVLLLAGCAETYDGPTQEVPMLAEYTVLHYSTFTDTVWEQRSVFAYDIYGNVASIRDYDDGELSQVCNYRYDDRGNRISSVCWDHSGWIPWIERRVKETYDDQDRPLTNTTYNMWGRETGRSAYTYDDVNHTTTWQNSEGDEVIYYYDENGLELRNVCTGVGGSYETVYEYDERGNRICWTSTKDGVFFDRYEAGYDDQGRQIWGRRYDEDGTLASQTAYTYDDEAHTKTTQKPDGSTRVEYYDADGNIYLVEDYNAEGQLGMYQEYYYRDIRVPID